MSTPTDHLPEGLVRKPSVEAAVVLGQLEALGVVVNGVHNCLMRLVGISNRRGELVSRMLDEMMAHHETLMASGIMDTLLDVTKQLLQGRTEEREALDDLMAVIARELRTT